MSDILYIGKTEYRNKEVKFGIKSEDRRRHFYVIGKTGMGKTTLLENMIIQDIEAGRGLAVVEPHGDLSENILNFIPKNRIKDVIYFNPADLGHPVAFNVMEKVAPEYRYLAASGVVGAFKKIWLETWGPRLEYLLRNAILALLEYPGATLLNIMRLLVDKDYRKDVISYIQDPVVKAFWRDEFSRYPDKFQVEAVSPIQNKVGQYITSPLIRNIIGQKRSSLDFREIMDEGKVLIVNLSKGRIGEDGSALLGAMIITKLQLAAMSRVDLPEEERRDFYLYVDEFQNFATESFTNILSEARKYHLNLILAHQYIAQVPEVVRDAVFGNAGSMATFRIGPEDAEFLEKEFLPEFNASDLCNLPRYYIYLKLMIDGVTSRPFLAKSLPPRQKPEVSLREEIIESSRKKYTTSREKVEKEIAKEWLEKEEEKKLYKSRCWVCGKEVEVPFKPEPGRPVYCKECLEKIRKNEIEAPSAPLYENKGYSLKDGKFVGLEELKKEKPKKASEKKKTPSSLEDIRKALEESLRRSKD